MWLFKLKWNKIKNEAASGCCGGQQRCGTPPSSQSVLGRGAGSRHVRRWRSHIQCGGRVGSQCEYVEQSLFLHCCEFTTVFSIGVMLSLLSSRPVLQHLLWWLSSSRREGSAILVPVITLQALRFYNLLLLVKIIYIVFCPNSCVCIFFKLYLFLPHGDDLY